MLFLLLLFAPVATDMSPGTVDHNAAAMVHVDRGELEAAYAEFAAAYAALPDPARDREAREAVMGSLRSVLLKIHAADRTRPEPLCRLQTLLRAHVDALVAAHPGRPDLLEIRGNEARLAAVARDLEPFGAGACTPAPTVDPPAAAAERSPPVIAPTSPPGGDESATGAGTIVPVQPAMRRPADAIPPRHLKIAGGVTLGLAAAALGVMAWRIADEAGLRGQGDAVGADAPGRPFTPAERDELLELRGHAQASRYQAIGAGVAAAGLSAVGVGLLVAAHRAARGARWSASPWWSPAGGGLTLRVQLGATARVRTSVRTGEP